MQSIHSDCCSSLSRHLDFFEMVRNEDDSELAKRFDMVSNLEWLLDNNLFFLVLASFVVWLK